MRQFTLLLVLVFVFHLVFGQTDGIKYFYNKYMAVKISNFSFAKKMKLL